ncbi:PREDICTED: putative invertase inhibitor [Camelina sativa]|uniref:Invertase inhibitor n=1 Tax=Camelina sativa TaxID=90675 RepID=A0ABM0X6B1_CAMSA|nr:PREDICTED: putative invertase inhibitor [Camelina sativa]
MKFLLYLVMFILLLNVFATAQSLIRDSCKKAAAKYPKLKYEFCVKSLEEHPQSKTAKSLEGLVFASTKNAVSKTTSLKGLANKILKENKYDVERPLRDCLELYTGAIDSLNQSLDTIKSRDYKIATMLMSAAMDATGNCETGFTKRKKPVKSPFTKENDVLFHMVLIPLAFTNMLDMNLPKVL